ncbi:cystathionine beta-lyase [compost metagenome]
MLAHLARIENTGRAHAPALRTVKTVPDEVRLVRLHIGLEHAPDLCADLAHAFEQMGE